MRSIFHGTLFGTITAVFCSVCSLANASVFFSEYIEGSSNNKALEIFNASGASIDLSAYAVQMYFNGNTNASLTIPLAGDLADGEVYVIAHSAASPDIVALADQTNGSGWFNGDDAVALLYGGAVIDIIGQIGIDPGSLWGSGDLVTANRSLRRLASVNQGDAEGFDAFDPMLEWESYPQDTVTDLGQHLRCADGEGGYTGCATEVTNQCGAAATRIHAIQGTGEISPLVGTSQSIEGVVVGDFQGSVKLNGFFVQEIASHQDSNSLTSEGIFVYSGSNDVEVEEGDLVRISGTVTEYFSMTQVNATAVAVCAANEDVVPAVLSLPVNSKADLEALEGMAIVVQQPLTVTENYGLGRYGELVLSANGRLYNPTQIALPGLAAQAVNAQNELRRIVLDDGSTRQNPALIPYPAPELSAYNTLRSGDSVQGLKGVLGYAFSEYRIHPISEPIFVPQNLRSSTPDLPAVGSFKIASFNVLNYFNGDGSGGGFPTSRGADTLAEFERQRSKIIAALIALDADVVGLIEIENDGYGAPSAIQDLIGGLADAGFVYAFVDPGVAKIGSDEITVGFIYKPDTMELVNSPKILNQDVDPRFIDTKNRPVLAQTFREIPTGGVVTVAVAHLKSKGSPCDELNDPDTGDGQGNCNLTRKAAAEAMADWLASSPTGVDDNDVLIIGDINSYAKEDPLAVLEAAGYSNLLQQMIGDEAYSYVFKGQAGYLDHALANDSLRNQITGISDWHINADEPPVLDYNEEFKTSAQLVNLYSPHAYRSSDHDPLIIELALENFEVIPELIPGDFDNDQRLTKKDLSLLLRNLGKTITDSNRVFDVTRDGRLNLFDALAWTFWLVQSQHHQGR